MHVLFLGWVERIGGNVDSRPDERDHNTCKSDDANSRPRNGVRNIGWVNGECKEGVEVSVSVECEAGKEEHIDVDGEVAAQASFGTKG